MVEGLAAHVAREVALLATHGRHVPGVRGRVLEALPALLTRVRPNTCGTGQTGITNATWQNDCNRISKTICLETFGYCSFSRSTAPTYLLCYCPEVHSALDGRNLLDISDYAPQIRCV